MDAVERQHHSLDGSVSPFVARNHARGMQSDESNGADWTSYDVNAAPGSQHFVYIFFDGHVAGDRGDIVGHKIGRAYVRERAAHGDLQETFLSGAEQEPSDEGGPQAADPVSVQRLPNAEDDHQ